MTVLNMTVLNMTVLNTTDSWSVDTSQLSDSVRAPSKAPVVSFSKKLLSLLSTGWFQERI